MDDYAWLSFLKETLYVPLRREMERSIIFL